MAFSAALRAGLGGHASFINLGQLSGDDSGGHCNDPIANDHNDGRHGLAEICLGRYVTVADGRQGYNCPINASWNTGEAGIRIFDKVHQRAEDNDQGEYGKQKNGDFPPACTQCLH